MLNFYDLSLPQLELALQGMGKERFRAQQLFKWVYQKNVTDFEQMTNLSKAFREDLPQLFSFELPGLVEHKISQQDGTQKFLFDVGSGLTVESVLIPSDGRLTLCVSSEVGCNLACAFCFTGKRKLKKRLSPSEINGQFLLAQKALPPDVRITNIVFMGMGEPLDNPENVFAAIDILHHPEGVGFSRRKVTVSTSGLVDQIPLVTQNRVRLAVSLNGSNDEVRSQIMPINKKYPISVLLEACREHCRVSRDKVTLEYVLLKGITDRLEHARELYHLTKSVPCKINIIPFNEHEGSDFLRPTDTQVARFQNELIRLGAHVLLRKTMGRDIYAACGQLTSKYEGRPELLKA